MEPSLAPAGTFISPNAYDPLRHRPSDLFWFHVEPCFRPLEEEDLVTLEKLKPASHSEVDAPLAQRLVAALLDEGKGAMNASRGLRTNTVAEPMWLPGALPALRSFNRIFETRVRTELEELGVLQHDEDDTSAVEQLRLDAWNLRSIGASCASSTRHVATCVADELDTQATRRDRKRKHDLLEVEYLKKMMETGGKRGKRFSKLLREMHPYHELAIGAPLPGSQTNGDNNAGGNATEKKSSKKKRKSSYSKHDASKLDRISKGTDNRAISAQSYSA